MNGILMQSQVVQEYREYILLAHLLSFLINLGPPFVQRTSSKVFVALDRTRIEYLLLQN